MKILIPNATNPENIGDLAILTGLIALIKKNNKLTIHSTEPHLYRPLFRNKISHTLYSWAVFDDIKFITRIKRICQLILNYVLITNNIKHFGQGYLGSLINDFMSADVILFVGGGSIRSKKGIKQTLNLLMTLFIFQFAKISKAKKIVAPISFGPFGYKWQEKYSANVLSDLDIVAVRESISYNLLKKYKLANLISSSDSSFFLNARKRNENQKRGKVILGFTIREWLSSNLQKNFETEFTNSIEMFTKATNALIQPIIQVDAPRYGENDRLITKEIIAKLKKKGCKVLPIKHASDLKNAMTIYSEIDLLLGMRMHSNIIAASQGTPFVALSYEYKTEGIAEQLGMKNYCIKVKDANRRLIFAKLMKAYKNMKSLKRRIKNSILNIQSVEINRWKYLLERSF